MATRPTYDHSSAFGRWGEIIVELTEVHDAQPAGLRDALTPGGGIGHVAWLAASLEEETDRLRGLGLSPSTPAGPGPRAPSGSTGAGCSAIPSRCSSTATSCWLLRDGPRGGRGLGRLEPLRIMPEPRRESQPTG